MTGPTRTRLIALSFLRRAVIWLVVVLILGAALQALDILTAWRVAGRLYALLLIVALFGALREASRNQPASDRTGGSRNSATARTL